MSSTSKQTFSGSNVWRNDRLLVLSELMPTPRGGMSEILEGRRSMENDRKNNSLIKFRKFQRFM